MRTVLVTAGIVLTAGAGLLSGRQAPAPAAATPPAAAAVAAPPAAAPAPPATEAYTYDPAGRRDPFVSVLGTGSETKQTSRRGTGPSGMLTSDITVRGVMQSGGTFLALVQGPDTKTYIMHDGDKLLDGTVKTINAEGVTIVQDVNDPLSLVKTREVHKALRSREDAKP